MLGYVSFKVPLLIFLVKNIVSILVLKGDNDEGQVHVYKFETLFRSTNIRNWHISENENSPLNILMYSPSDPTFFLFSSLT